jgi:hypothetical protein
LTKEEVERKIHEANAQREQALMLANVHEGRRQAYQELLEDLEREKRNDAGEDN